MKRTRVMAGAIAAVLLSSVMTAAAPPKYASVILIWRVPAPQAQSEDVQAVEAGLVAVNFLAPQLSALARHPAAKVTLALDPAFVDALERAATGQDAIALLASGALGADDPRAAELLAVLSTTVVPAANLQGARAVTRFVSDAEASRLALMGDSAARFSHGDDADYAATALLLSLVGSGYARGQEALLNRDALTVHDLAALAPEFALACNDVLARLKKASASGAVELAALPAYEPIVPLVIDAAGRNERVPFTVALNGGADAAAAVDEGMRAVRSLDPTHPDPGLVLPSGAYDDETATLLQSHRAQYGVFSERVVKASVGAAAASVADARSAAYRAYLMETSKTTTLPIFFCSDSASTSIDAQPLASPASAMADRLQSVVKAALDVSPNESAPVVVLCLPANGSILHRADRASALDFIAAALSGNKSKAQTPHQFLKAHPPTADTYGYEAASDVGGFDMWMGSQNQMSMWNALSDARRAAGGDAALSSAAIRDALLRAESGRWFATLMLPQPRYLTEATLAQFRALIAQIYRAANKPVPASIAPVKLNATPPSSTPTPTATRAPSPASSPANASGAKPSSSPPNLPTPSSSASPLLSPSPAT